jgi:imidazolonepropionase
LNDVHDLVIHNARVYPDFGSGNPTPVSSFAVTGGRVERLEVAADAPARRRLDARGGLVLPGFVDCHTHLCYTGNRMNEHASRLAGVSYAEIAVQGGGIRATVAAVATASEDELVAQSLPRLRALAREGVTTVEIKSGYGLTPEHELKQLRAIRRLGEIGGIRVIPTFLALHALPAGTTPEHYVHQVITDTLPAVAAERLAEGVDVFCEHIAFSVKDMLAVFERARELGLACCAHTDQLRNLGGTRAAAAFGARSCDHLEYTAAADIEAMAAAGTVAVLLPGAYYCLRETQAPPVTALREAGIPMAIATDLNPGTSPVASPLAILHLASTLFGLHADEALAGLTQHGAAALGCDDIGTLRPGAHADFTLWDVPGPEFFSYQLGGIQPSARYIEGVPHDI